MTLLVSSGLPQMRKFIISGSIVEMFIDSGAGRNLLTFEDFRTVATSSKTSGNEVQILATETAPLMMAFASDRPLKVIAAMRAEIAPSEAPDEKMTSEFYCILKAKQNLLSYDTGMSLGVLRVGYEECRQNTNILKVYSRSRLTMPDKFNTFPKFPGFQLTLEVDQNVAPKCRNFDIVSAQQVDAYRRELENLFEQQIIEDAEFPCLWVHSALAAPKNHGKSIRICIDLRALNEALINNIEFPMPTCKSMLRFSKGKRYFAKIDLSSAFLHIELAPESRHLMTFYTRFGYFRFTRMPFGLKSAPWVFQSIMYGLLMSLNKDVIVYIDDILMGEETLEKLRETFDAVMSVLKKNNFVINELKNKTVFGETSIEIVGFRASMDTISITDERLRVVDELKEPDSLKLVKSALGFFGFFGHHIPNFGEISDPLWQLIRNKKFEWNGPQIAAFKELKRQARENQILFHFDRLRKTYLLTDASWKAASAILFQIEVCEQSGVEVIKIISFASKLFSKSQSSYHQFEREIFAVVFGLNHFREYLLQLTEKTNVLTDLRTARIIMEKSLNHQKIVMKRFDRWMVSVQDIPYTVSWIPGKLNIADCLSRLSEVVSISKGAAEFERDYVVDYDDEEPIDKEEIALRNTICLVCNVMHFNDYLSCDEVRENRFCFVLN